MSNSMIHMNGNQPCVIDTETTGLNPNYHEMIQICILPLDSNFKPRKDVFPFYIEMIPEHPERADPKAMEINRLNFAKIAQRGHDRYKAKDMFEEWVVKLKLPSTKYGRRKQILPLGQNYGFDKGFIEAWLGNEMYNEFFHYGIRDTKIAATYLNDRAAMHAEKIPFPKLSLGSLAKRLNVIHEKAHDALSDCQTTAEIYRQLLMQGLLG